MQLFQLDGYVLRVNTKLKAHIENKVNGKWLFLFDQDGLFKEKGVRIVCTNQVTAWVKLFEDWKLNAADLVIKVFPRVGGRIGAPYMAIIDT